jgi:glutamine amidotransferase
MIAVVDSGVANLTSVMAALQRLNAEAEITADAEHIRAADRVIVPGVGAAEAAMTQLREKNLIDVLRDLKQPVLGICLGMQLLFASSNEGKYKQIQCLNVIPGTVEKLPTSPENPVPHMGWNQITPAKPGHPLLRGVEKGDYVYFVHSYAVAPGAHTLATTDYGASFASVVGAQNFFGCQFHPERSGAVGNRILQNFIGI